jgi:gluconolactonase
MKTKLTTLLILAATATPPAAAQENDSIIAPGATVTLLAGGFRFTEGPAADSDGNIYFTDQPNNQILKWTVDDATLSVFTNTSGRANGLSFDPYGHLLACSDMENEIWQFDMQGHHRILLTGYEGKRLNGPNDLWIHPDGGIYFTDPLYPRDYWTRSPDPQQDGEHVYYLPPGSENPIRAATDLSKPNGITGSPDGRHLYVADIQAGKTYVYEIRPDATLANRTLFAPIGSDGMTTDSNGNIYLTGKGITVFNPEGRQIAHIPVEAGWTANVCFGGKDRKTLFITATEHLYSLRMNVTGIHPKPAHK